MHNSLRLCDDFYIVPTSYPILIKLQYFVHNYLIWMMLLLVNFLFGPLFVQSIYCLEVWVSGTRFGQNGNISCFKMLIHTFDCRWRHNFGSDSEINMISISILKSYFQDMISKCWWVFKIYHISWARSAGKCRNHEHSISKPH